MKQNRKEARLQRRRDDYDRNHNTDGGYTRPGSIKKSSPLGKGKRR